MKIISIIFLTLINLGFAAEKKAEIRVHPLFGFQKFEVLTFFSPYDKIEKNLVYTAEINAFKQFAPVAISNSDSMLVSLVQNEITFPVFYFSIDKENESFKVSLELLADVEVIANKHRTSCPIWKKTLYSPIQEGKNQENISLTQVMQEMVKCFLEDWKKANGQDLKQLNFRVHTAKDI